jgi:lipoate-protein ligase A
MNLSWQIIESGHLSPEAVMAKDAFLLAQLGLESPPLLHFYEWDSPCLTYGYFTDPARYLDMEALRHCGLQAARRPTGGGIIFHLSDLAFSVLVPASHSHFSLNTLDNYAFINQKVAKVIAHFSHSLSQPQLLHSETSCSNQDCKAFCMAKPTQYDLIIDGKKVGGAAQRRTKHGLLHQASLSLLFPPIDLLCRLLKNHEVVLEAMQRNSYCLLSRQSTVKDLQEARDQIKMLLAGILQD